MKNAILLLNIQLFAKKTYIVSPMLSV